jgi:hypothetical protein
MTREICLLLTATVRVANSEMLRPTGRSDTDLRRNDYASALVDWLTRQSAVSHIVFVDNSGYPLDSLHEIADRHRTTGKKVEFVSFRTTGYTEARGRSFGELDILDKALERSVLLRGAEHFAKVNGRVFVPNFDRIVAGLAPDFDIVGRLAHNLTWLDTVLVLFRTSVFAERLLPYALQHVDDSTCDYIERVLARGALRCIADGLRWYPFPAEPLVRGIRALDGKPYADGKLRAKLIDAFAWGHHRATDTSRGRSRPHPQDRWPARSSRKTPSTADGGGGPVGD